MTSTTIASTPETRPARGRRAAVIALAAGLVVAALALLVAPSPHRLSDVRSGDPDSDERALADRVAPIVGDERTGYRGLSVALVDPSGTTTATVGDPAGGPLFEIGSVTKVLTGMLLADLVEDGTVRPDEPLRALLPDVRFTDERVGDITLAELASHRSGLPRLATTSSTALRSAWANLRGANPYGEDVDDLRRQAADARVGSGRGEVHYSNFGMALLGQALAARTGTPYPELVSERILRPLGMSDTLLTVDDPPPPGLAAGSTASGRPVAAWSGVGYAPAGVGPRSTAADLAKLVAAVRDGRAPGATAAIPRFDAGDDSRIGYAWFTDQHDDQQITWHNGATGGFSSYVGFDRASGRAVVVLGNTDRGVEWIGIRLLGASAEPSATTASPWLVWMTLGLLLYVVVALPLLAFARAGHSAWWNSAPDRARLIATTLASVALLLVAHRLGTWLSVPPLLWALTAGVAAAGAALVVLRWRDLPLLAGGPRSLRWTAFAGSIASSVLVIGVTLTVW
ncbi:serine hydrolase domain-containing protein [Cryptosporangium minutisporangium]|uniref:Beta-lactamase-related domain-containing protein n=1 Tax=Cryptosporangium minutisporangium TaxID=113569 RepID=A0ABP6T3D8_9ACTN